jgi:hypothetical protein
MTSRQSSLILSLLTATAVALPTSARAGDTNIQSNVATVAAAFTKKTGEFSVTGPGVTRLLAGFSALVEIGGKTITLRSTDGKSEAGPVESTEQTPNGMARMLTTSLSFPDQGITLGLRLGTVSGEGIVLLHPFLKNSGSQPIHLLWIGIESSGGKNGGLALVGGDWILTSLDHTTLHDGPPVSLLDSSFRERTIREYGSLYQPDGTGFLFAPVGEPAAYLTTTLARSAGEDWNISIDSVMSGVTVDPGETREGQETAIWFRPPREALAKWADWVGATHHVRHSNPLSGWCSWYHLTHHIKGSDVLGVVDAALKQPDRLRPQVIQLDDGYMNFDGVWEGNSKFPEGMAFYAKKMAETGARPGLWVCPVMIGEHAPWMLDPEHRKTVWDGKFFKESPIRPDNHAFIDPTHPLSREEIARQIRDVVDKGFTYLKIDKASIGSGNWHDKKLTSFQVMRQYFGDIRKGAGEGTYIQACIMQPERAVIGYADAGRAGHDASRSSLRTRMDDVLRSYHLNRRWMVMDNDIYYMAPDVKSVGLVSGGWDLLHTWISMMGLSSGAALTSDPWHWPEMKDHLRSVEIMQPPASERAEVLDLGTSKEWPRLASLIRRPWGNQAVVLLWNPGKEPRAIDLQLSQTGLDPIATCAVWSFWDDAFLGLTKGSWTTPKLAPGGCQQLVFTPVDPSGGKLVLIGSNLHIHSGAAEIARVESGDRGIRIDLTDAGAREGDLFLWSAQKPKLLSATGLEVSGIENAKSPDGASSDHAWKVSISGRKTGLPQRLVFE